MVNRSIQQKQLKMKRRKRFARFSGETSKYAVRIDRGRYEGVTKVGQEPHEDYVPSGKNVLIPVGEVSLSKAVINTGRGPDKLRMQEYYNRARNADPIPDTIGGSVPIEIEKQKNSALLRRYAEHIKGVPREMRINLVSNAFGMLDLYFQSDRRKFFFVDVTFRTSVIKKSITYATRERAMQALNHKRVVWVEITSPNKASP